MIFLHTHIKLIFVLSKDAIRIIDTENDVQKKFY